MKHAPRTARRAVFALLFQNGKGVCRGTAGVDDQGQLRLLCGLNVDAKTVALPFHIGHGAFTQTEVIQTRFTNAHHTRQLSAGQQIVQRRFLHAFVVGMNADSSPEIVKLRGEAVNFRKTLQRGADHQSACDLRLGHVFPDGVYVFNQLWKVEVAV